MNIIEAYSFLFVDSFVSSLVLPAKQALVLPVMKMFGGYNLYLASLVSTIGITAASCVNWLLGRLLRLLKRSGNRDQAGGRIALILSFLQKHGYFMALLAFIPVLGPMLIVLAGLANASFIRVILIVFTVNIIANMLLTVHTN